jgi:hypothetical protein
MLIIDSPTLSEELEWVCDIVFKHFLGLVYVLRASPGPEFRLSHAGRHIALPDIFFSKLATQGFCRALLPASGLPSFDAATSGLDAILVDPRVPVIFGSGENCSVDGDAISLPIDIFGAAFFMLSRYEEMFGDTRDLHSRFPASASIASREQFLDRPIIDEYVEILWAAIHHLWPHWRRKARVARTLVSCDLDHPFDPAFTSPLRLARRIGGRVWRERSARCIPLLIRTYRDVQRDIDACDPYRQAIDWIMEQNTAAGNCVAFYVIPEQTDAKYDRAGSLESPRMRRLIREIHAGGHEIGIHFGYNTYRDENACARSLATFRRVMDEEQVSQASIGARQHYLRWKTPTTARLLDKLGLSYDSTLSFADRPGFRCGTCHEYPMYDLVNRRALKILQRPLVTMEAERYAGDKFKRNGPQIMQRYKDICFKFGGNFTMLWHNSYFEDPACRASYSKLIENA